MKKKLTDIPGIGPATAVIMDEQGFTTILDVANATPDMLTAMPGFGIIRANRIIAAAQKLLEVTLPADQTAVNETEEAQDTMGTKATKTAKKKKKSKKKISAKKKAKKKSKKKKGKNIDKKTKSEKPAKNKQKKSKKKTRKSGKNKKK
ncbi:MAG: helix-hairpin-helix domain-containing protein [Thermodesulfobacteriota bacterium]|nr:helix-hairpin-helix domain-containing protein [Thermodesulfobacteriota bacterium]